MTNCLYQHVNNMYGVAEKMKETLLGGSHALASELLFCCRDVKSKRRSKKLTCTSSVVASVAERSCQDEFSIPMFLMSNKGKLNMFRLFRFQ